MKKSIESPNLYNCTATLLQRLDPGLDVESVWTLNHSELLELLEATFSETENSAKKTEIRDFMSECLILQNPYEMVWWQKLMWTAIFASMLVVATGGNTIVMWIVLGEYNI